MEFSGPFLAMFGVILAVVMIVWTVDRVLSKHGFGRGLWALGMLMVLLVVVVILLARKYGG